MADDDGRPAPLWREALGEHLRGLRLRRGETLAETAGRAGVSPQYLSEIERGIKEPSSEMIAAVGGALGASLFDLAAAVASGAPRVDAPLAPRVDAEPVPAPAPAAASATALATATGPVRASLTLAA